MPSIDAWAGDAFPLADWSDDADPAVDNARITADKLTSITVVRAGVEQSAQNVRLEEMRGDRTIVTAAGQTATVDALIIGYKGHATITNTDLQRGDRFKADSLFYEVVAVVPNLSDSLQAYAVVRS